MNVRLTDPALMSEFAGFLAVPKVAVERLDSGEIAIRPRGADGDEHQIVVEMLLEAWNAAHADAQALVVAGC